MLCNEGQMIPKRCFRQFCKLSTNELAVEQVLQLQKQGVVGVLCADAGRIEALQKGKGDMPVFQLCFIFREGCAL